jgi:hypothetical protein
MRHSCDKSAMDDMRKPIGNERRSAVPGWKNPYVLYIVLITLLFGLLMLIGWLAYQNGWIPSRGVT